MSHSIAIPEYQLVEHDRAREMGRARYLILSAVVGMIIGAIGFAVTVSTVDVVRTALAAQPPTVEPLVSYPAHEIPPEWQWNPKPGNYDAMYQGIKPRRPDWIRNSEAGKRFDRGNGRQ